MTDIRFGRLEDLPLREAWKQEAYQFTPWLAENIDHLSEAIGIPLELIGTEVPVESFSADILARNPMDDTIVLIENQLEKTDHTHLGQIMTYLAGLEAHTVVWIAPEFREPHLSAIRWLNEHTADGFSFFAVKARVVRIGNSPLAPIFEIIEKPDAWLRRLQTQVGVRKTRESMIPHRKRFWEATMTRYPDMNLDVEGQSLYTYLDDNEDLYLSFGVRRERMDFAIRSESTADRDELLSLIEAAAPTFAAQLGPIQATNGGYAYNKSTSLNLLDEATWQNAIDEICGQAQAVINAFAKGPVNQ
jgi:hypothetical protein